MALSGCRIGQLKLSGATAYRLRPLAGDQEKAERALLDDRHAHRYQVTQPVQAWLSEFGTANPPIASSRLQSERQSCFGVTLSLREPQAGAGKVRGKQPLAWSGPAKNRRGRRCIGKDVID